MDQSFARLLRECRHEANLTQIALGRRIHLDGSMISRFETGKTRPNASTLQGIVNALSLSGVPRQQLDRLWEAAGYYRSDLLQSPVAHPVVQLVNQEFERLEPQRRQFLADELRSSLEMQQEYFLALEDISKRRFTRASESLALLRAGLERHFQHWNLCLDKQLGWSNYNLGQYARAVSYYESALWAARQTGDLQEVASLLLKLGDVHRRRGGPELLIARDCYSQARDIFDSQLGDGVAIAECIRKIAGTYLLHGRPDLAYELLQQSRRMCEMENDFRGTYKALQHLAWARRLLGDWGEATRLSEDALSMVKTAGSDDQELAKAFRYLGDAYATEKRAAEAEDAYEQSLEILNKSEQDASVDREILIARVRLGLARLYLKRRGWESKANRLLQASMTTHHALAEEFAIAEAMSEEGELLTRVGRLEAAEGRLHIAAKYFETLGNAMYYAKTLARLCVLYYTKGPAHFDKLYSIAEAARLLNTGLIDQDLATVELFVGKARVDQEAYPEGVSAFEAASEKALHFNAQTFRDVCVQISEQVDLTAKTDPDRALKLCQSQIEYWEGRLEQLHPADRQPAGEWLKTLEQKCEEARALASVD
jgi:tetratricopeptide (TPR) repeat protein